jgi:TatD DNase family protein
MHLILTPVPKRGKRNESAYLVYVAQAVAKMFDISVNEVAEITRKMHEIYLEFNNLHKK